MRDEYAVITHHEAGHAVASLMTPNNSIDTNGAVTARLIDGRGDGGSELLVSGDHPREAAFLVYAGPWADARVQSGIKRLNSLNDLSAYGKPFREMVDAAFIEGRGLLVGQSDEAIYKDLKERYPEVMDSEEVWCSLLERAWPVIEELARELRSRFGEPEIRCNGPLSNVFQTATMPGGEVVGLVRPMLQAEGLWRCYPPDAAPGNPPPASAMR